MDFNPSEKFHLPNNASTPPQMNSILEETTPSADRPSYKTPDPSDSANRTPVDLGSTSNIAEVSQLDKTGLVSPKPMFYKARDMNTSSLSIVYNPSFTFGGTGTPNTNAGANVNFNPYSSQHSANNSSSNLNLSAVGSVGNPAGNSTSNLPAVTNGTSPSTTTVTPPPSTRTLPTRNREKRRSGYIPTNVFPGIPPPPILRSPLRSPSPESSNRSSSKRSSAILDGPFNFGQSSPIQGTTPPSTATTRTQFRKGHRYKRSSVSLNFFQEPEVRIPLNIAKSLPIPDFDDLKQNIPWPRAYIQLSIVCLQILMCLVTFGLGHIKSWSNFVTLSHFIAYDIIGSLTIIFVEVLSQFEVWFTGTITYPFGLNRVDVLSSFALAVSLCFVGLDLLFHILEEIIVMFVEAGAHGAAEDLTGGPLGAAIGEALESHHSEISSQIPHSHHGGSHSIFLIAEKDINLWYSVLVVNLIVAILSLRKTFISNKNSKLKTKNPVITVIYTLYLFVYPSISGFLSNISDYIATLLIAVFILIHGLTISEWTSTILLLGFSTTSLPGSTILLDPTTMDSGKASGYVTSKTATTKTNSSTSSKTTTGTDGGNDGGNGINFEDDDKKRNNERGDGNSFNALPKKIIGVRPRSMSTLPVAITLASDTTHSKKVTWGVFSVRRIMSLFGGSSSGGTTTDDDPNVIKGIIKDKIESLSEFKQRCSFNADDLTVLKVNFNLFVVLVRLVMKGGSNDDELKLRLAVDKSVKELLPDAETTIEIDRV